MTIEPVTPKPGVLFIQTPSGGILMDIQADRFIALSPLSSLLWSGLAAGQRVQDLTRKIMQTKRVQAEQAEAILSSQFDRWKNAELINASDRSPSLPHPKVVPVVSPRELTIDKVLRERVAPLLVAQLYVTELHYRRALMKRGLARTLVMLQEQHGAPREAPEAIMVRTVRNYHALRRAFRQGQRASDCLFRSLALAAVLRRQGVQADLCIGIIDLPFSSHAWVEACGRVLNETVQRRNAYAIIGRF